MVMMGDFKITSTGKKWRVKGSRIESLGVGLYDRDGE